MERRLAAILLLILFAAQVAVLVEHAGREPNVDEVEYLHAGWLMASGGTVYKTFFEHHSALLFAAIAPFAPPVERADVRPYAERARLLCGMIGLIALGAYALVVWRLNSMAAVIALAAIFAAAPLWQSVIADVRFEPFALAFFWSGVALVLLPRGRLALPAGGVGVALVFVAALWTPKWPIASAVVVAWWIARLVRSRGRWIAAIVIAGATIVTALALVHMIVPLDTFSFFTFELNRPLSAHAPEALAIHFGGGPFQYAPALFRPAIVIAASILVMVAAWRDSRSRGALFFVALFAASVAELRFVHPYPAIWIHNYAMWSFSAAAILGATPSAIATLLERTSLRGVRLLLTRALPATLLIVLAANIAALWVTRRSDDSTYWVSQRVLSQRIRPGETVWLPPNRHPISVRDAHYYWMGFSGIGVLQTARELLQTERGARHLPPIGELPLCAALHGSGRLRFASEPSTDSEVATEARCYETLRKNGRVRITMVPGVVEIVPSLPEPAARIRPRL